MRVIRGQASSGNQIREARHQPSSEPERRHPPDQLEMLWVSGAAEFLGLLR
jgi:hypothetical protein